MTRIILACFLIVQSILVSSQINSDNNTVFFKDSITSAYKLMSASVHTNTPKKMFSLGERNGLASNFDFSDIHTLRFYALTQSEVTIKVTCFSAQTQSKPIEYELVTRTSGYISEKFPVPTLTADNQNFNYKQIDAVQIEVIGDGNILLDEFSFYYSEDTILVTGPDGLSDRLEEEKKSYRKKKEKENNSEFLKNKMKEERQSR